MLLADDLALGVEPHHFVLRLKNRVVIFVHVLVGAGSRNDSELPAWAFARWIAQKIAHHFVGIANRLPTKTKPNKPRPVAKSGRAAGSGTGGGSPTSDWNVALPPAAMVPGSYRYEVMSCGSPVSGMIAWKGPGDTPSNGSEMKKMPSLAGLAPAQGKQTPTMSLMAPFASVKAMGRALLLRLALPGKIRTGTGKAEGKGTHPELSQT